MKEIHTDVLANSTERSTLSPADVGTCCREKGLTDDCIGHCFDIVWEGSSVLFRVYSGICRKWFSAIKDCYEGTFIH